MSTVSVQLPDSLHEKMEELAAPRLSAMPLASHDQANIHRRAIDSAGV